MDNILIITEILKQKNTKNKKFNIVLFGNISNFFLNIYWKIFYY